MSLITQEIRYLAHFYVEVIIPQDSDLDENPSAIQTFEIIEEINFTSSEEESPRKLLARKVYEITKNSFIHIEGYMEIFKRRKTSKREWRSFEILSEFDTSRLEDQLFRFLPSLDQRSISKHEFKIELTTSHSPKQQVSFASPLS